MPQIRILMKKREGRRKRQGQNELMVVWIGSINASYNIARIVGQSRTQNWLKLAHQLYIDDIWKKSLLKSGIDALTNLSPLCSQQLK